MPVTIPGAKPRAILSMLGLHGGSVVAADTLVELLWGEDPPRTAAKALQTHISSLRRTLGDGFVLTAGAGWTLAETQVDAARYKSAARLGRDAAAAGDTSQAVARFEEALALWRGIPELPDGRRGTSEKTRWIESHAALVEDRADALLATGRAAEIIGELEAAVADAPLRERRWGQLMLALYRAGRQGEALGAYQRARALLADELGVDPGPDLRRLEAAIVAQDSALEMPAAQQLSSVTRAVTFLLTDIEGSTAAWEADAGAMAVALARHDELVEQVVTSRGGRLIKTRGEGDATFSVFERPSAAAAAAIELQDAIAHEPWVLREPMRIRVALHTGEVELRDGDYFGRAVNRAARLRSLATGGQILCSGATAELVIDSLSEDVVLADLGTRQLRNLARPEHVFELQLQTAPLGHPADSTEVALERPSLPPVLAGPGPFVGRGHELDRLSSAWQTALAGGTKAMLIAGEPGVGKTRLAGEWSRQAFDQGALVIYGRCDEDLGAPYQPFAEALRSLVPCLGAGGLRGLRGVEALLTLVPGLADLLPDLAAPTRADPDTERYALFDAVVALLATASASAPVVLILDDLHWAAKPTLLLLRHLLRFGEHARMQIIGTYRSTDLDRSHPLAAMLADLHRDGTADRLSLSGLHEDDVTAYVAEAGYNDEELARALASVTGGNPFFLIEALRHVDESGGRWDQSTLPQGVREAVSRRLSRLPAEANKALAAAAVVGSRFALDLVERVLEDDLVDAFDEACKAGIVIEEPGGRYRFNHAIVRQSLLAELPSVRRMRLHQRIATTLENEPGADDELLAELAYHYFECAWAGNAAKAVEYCRRAADQAMARLAYEGAADLYDRALHALEEIDEELPDRDDQTAELLIARCEALLAAGDVASAGSAVSQLQSASTDSRQLAAWATCFDGQLSMLIHPERLDDVAAAVGSAAEELAQLGDAAGEAMAHTVRAGCLARLGRIGDGEIALDDALSAARRAREHRRVNAVLANAPLAALWGPNPVPRAGGRCLDVVRLLRITTDSPAVEATSTRCQAVLEAFRGRGAAARRMIDSARRTATELGLRHSLMEVEQFAGIVELVVDEPAAAEPHLRKAYNGFRRMGLDADTAETAALLGRACLALDRDAEADELSTESERLAGHALKASIAWRTLRARLLSRRGDHDEARRVAEEAVGLAERTDALVDHGDACLSLATVLGAAGDIVGARAAAERAAELYERKGAAALAEKARRVLGAEPPPAADQPEAPPVKLDNACVRAICRLDETAAREAWNELEEVFAPNIAVESRRKIVGLSRINLSPSEWATEAKRFLATGLVRCRRVVIGVRGDRLALVRTLLGAADVSPGAPEDELLHLIGLDVEGRIALQVSFDVEDIDAALAELEARFEAEHPIPRRLENTASRVFENEWSHFAARDWDGLADTVADDYVGIDHRRVVSAETQLSRDDVVRDLQAAADVGFTISMVSAMAIRGERLVLARVRAAGRDPEAIQNDALNVVEIDGNDRIANVFTYDVEDIGAAIAQLDARYLAGEGAPYATTWQIVTGTFASMSRHEFPALPPDCATIDHRNVAAFAPGELPAYIRAGLDIGQDITTYVSGVHRLNDLGAVVSYVAYGNSNAGLDGEWHEIALLTLEGRMVNRCELFYEADLQTAIAKFEQLSRPASHLENAATEAYERVYSYFAARDWDALAAAAADSYSIDDRRRVVNAGIRHGRDAAIKEMRAIADVGFATMTILGAVATRGARLALMRIRFSGRDPDTIQNDALNVVEVDADEHVRAVVVFDLEDFDAALAELDVRFIAGEGAAYARTWSVITGAFAAHNRRELAEATSDAVSIDHRRGAAFAPGEGADYLRAGWDLDQQLDVYVEALHRINDLGAVFTWAGHATSHVGFAAEWRGVNLMTVDDRMISRAEVFEETELDIAIKKFTKLSRAAPQLENAASQAYERFRTYFAARDWAAMAELLTADTAVDDHRRVVSAEIRHGRDVEIANMRAFAEIGVTTSTAEVIATRGERLVLCRTRISGEDHPSGGFSIETLVIVETSAEEQILARVAYDPDDFDAAIEELEARYLAGEAAPHARMWAAMSGAYVAINRRELPPLTGDFKNIDHRRGAAFAPGDMLEYLRAGWDLDQDIHYYVEAVYRLSDLGVVVTHKGCGTSRDGFDAEWREVMLFTADGDLFSRCEVFDEADLDAALARFEDLGRPAPPRVENAATSVYERLQAFYVARDWPAITKMLPDNCTTDDRRAVVGGGIQQGRNALIDNLQAVAEGGITNATSDTIAIRGAHLALTHARYARGDGDPAAFHVEYLQLIEIDADERIAALVAFDTNDADAAFEELDSRYLKGEGATHSRAWSVIMAGYAALNRHELPPITLDFASIDHRRGTAYGPGEQIQYVRAGWDLDQRIQTYPEGVHRLSDAGAVYTHVAQGTSREGFDAEWRGISLVTVDGDLVSRSEVFDEADLDKAIARFDELSRPARQLENAASRVADRFSAYYAANDWRAMAEVLAENYSSDDRRRVVGSEVRHGRDAHLLDMRARAEIWLTNRTSTVMATRGDRLALMRIGLSGRDQGHESFVTEALIVNEIDADERLAAGVAFGPDDLDAAVAELDARYLAGQAAAYAHIWSVVTGVYAMFNRQELHAVDWAIVDHRRATPFASSDLAPALRNFFDLTPEFRVDIETVHRLNHSGAVITLDSHGFSHDGLGVEWRMIQLLVVEGDRISRCEMFDETDLDAAIARLEELSRPSAQLVNTTTRVLEQFLAHFAAQRWDEMASLLAEDFCSDDRRSVINAGIRRGRDVEMANWRATAEVWMSDVQAAIIATRGERLALFRFTFASQDSLPAAFQAAALGVIEVNDDNRFASTAVFDPDDLDAAITELEARYIAGEGAPHARIWSLLADAFAAINRHELPERTPNWANIDHRRGAAFATGDMTAYIRDLWSDAPDIHVYIEVVHRLSNLGAVVTQVAHGTSQHGFEAEWREIGIVTFDDDLLSRCELFDPADLGAALVRFEELSRPTRRLENAASRAEDRLFAHAMARDWAALAEALADDSFVEDRRRVVNIGVWHGRAVVVANMRALAEGLAQVSLTVIATRGERLALVLVRSFNPDLQRGEFVVEMLGIAEINADGRLAAHVLVDVDDMDAAFAELDARYVAGEAAAHARTWSAIAESYAAINRGQLPSTTTDFVDVDHRRGAAMASGELIAFLRSALDQTPNLTIRIAAVHRLSQYGAVVTHAAAGASPEGFEAEWREVSALTVDGDMLSHCEVFDEADLDAALARFDELHRPMRRLENRATRAEDRFFAYSKARDWAAVAETLAEGSSIESRVPVVNTGLWEGRDVVIANLRALAENVVTTTSAVLAIRGERLALSLMRHPNSDARDGEFAPEQLIIVEIDPGDRIAAHIVFDPDDMDAALAELDARYLAGEAAAHAHTWSLVTQGFAAFIRHEIPPTTTDPVYIDHRPLVAIEGVELAAAMRAVWGLTPNVRAWVEAVHRLSDLGAVISGVVKGTSPEGFDAEWQMINICTFEGDLLSRYEVFEKTELDAALARFDELPQRQPLANPASQVNERFWTCLTTQDWAALTEIMAENVVSHDNRRVVNSGVLRGRETNIANVQAVAEVGFEDFVSTVIAVRGRRLALTRIRSSAHGFEPGEISADMIGVVEVDADNRMTFHSIFDADDIDAAFAQLDARYLAGEAAAHAHVWSVIARECDRFNRHELPAADWVTIDHRSLVTIDAGDLLSNIRATWDLMPDVRVNIEAVHRLGSSGAVVTYTANGTAQEGFVAEWRMIHLLTVEDDRINRSELFEEGDLDAALARFEELQEEARRPENAATLTDQRFWKFFAAGDWAALASTLADDMANDDRRRIVNAGVRRGRDFEVANMQTLSGMGVTHITSTIIATRGERLLLRRTRFSRDAGPEDFHAELLCIVELDAENRIATRVLFDPDNMDAAFEELDARYLAGEAAPHAHTWSVIAGSYDAMNRRELFPTTPDWVNIDHRRPGIIEEGGLNASLRSLWQLTTDLTFRIVAVHRLTDLGMVCSHVAQGVSHDGFDAEWRGIEVQTIDGHLIDRCEIFDEADLDAALARFDELVCGD
ncbi:regulator [Mycobacterium sp. E2733]|nr:regulator [Mycobacterium sp. E2733]